MSAEIFKPVAPGTACRSGRRYEGTVGLTQMVRLADILASNQGTIRYDLSFSLGSKGRWILDMELEASLPLLCQRSLQVFMQTLRTKTRLALLEDARMQDELPEDIEPCLIDGQEIRMNELIEDELLLVIPLVPVDPSSKQPGFARSEEIMPLAETKPASAFAVLSGLKKTD